MNAIKDRKNQQEFVQQIIEAAIWAGMTTANISSKDYEAATLRAIRDIQAYFDLPLNQLPMTKQVVEGKVSFPENYRIAIREMAACFFGYKE